MIENNCKCETKTKDNVFVTVTVAVQQVPIRDLVYDAIYKLDDPNQQVRGIQRLTRALVSSLQIS